MNMQALMRQAQSLQKDMMKAKDEIESSEFTGESSLVKITINGKREVLKIKINTEESIEADEIEMLEDMIMIAMNDAIKKVDKMTENKLGKFANGMPGLF